MKYPSEYWSIGRTLQNVSKSGTLANYTTLSEIFAIVLFTSIIQQMNITEEVTLGVG